MPVIPLSDWPARADWARDRALRLTVLDFGLFRVHANGRVIGIPGYLISTASGRHILVDTGFPPAYATDAAAASARDGLGSFGEILRLTDANLACGQLEILGLTPADVDLVILSHGDIDHVGSLDAFTHAPILIGTAERALPRPRYFGSVQPIPWPDATYIAIDADTALCNGLAVLATPGHSPGHLSLRLDLPQSGRIVVTADAISRPSEPDEGMRGSWDAAEALRQAGRLIAMANGGAMIYGHCPVQWPGLRKAPEAYD